MKQFLQWVITAGLAGLAAACAVSAATSHGYYDNPEVSAFFAVVFGFSAFGVYRTIPPKQKAAAAE